MENLISNISNENEVIEAVKSNPTILLERLEKDGRSLLHIAAGFGKLKLVELLIQMGSDLNAQDKFLESPIFRAVRFRKEDCVTALVQAGAKLDILDYKGQTVLHRAFAMATSAIASVLIKYGADASIRDDYGQTALDLCKQSKFNSNQLNNFLSSISIN
jgi:ankyrin repeat protein